MTRSLLHRLTSSAIAVTLATTALLVGGSDSAQAASTWQLNDNMEDSGTLAKDRFFFESDSIYAGGQIVTAGGGYSYRARSGTQAAILHNTDGGTWASVGRNVNILPKAYTIPTSCHFVAWVYGASTWNYNIEVIDPSTWRYITVKRVTQPTDWGWGSISTAEFSVPKADVVLRVSYLLRSYGSAAFVDDFSLVCRY